MTGAEIITQHIREDWREPSWTFEGHATGLQRKLAAKIDAELAAAYQRGFEEATRDGWVAASPMRPWADE